MDETLAELFTWHESAENFEGNWRSAFSTTIVGMEYGPNEMLASIGLYDGRYTFHFHPGEVLVCGVLECKECYLTCACSM